MHVYMYLRIYLCTMHVVQNMHLYYQLFLNRLRLFLFPEFVNAVISICCDEHKVSNLFSK